MGAGVVGVGLRVLNADFNFEPEDTSERGDKDLRSKAGREGLKSLGKLRRQLLFGVCGLLLVWKVDGPGLRPYANTGHSEVQCELFLR